MTTGVTAHRGGVLGKKKESYASGFGFPIEWASKEPPPAWLPPPPEPEAPTADVLFAYVEGYDLDEVAPTVRAAVERFVAGRAWAFQDVHEVDFVEEDEDLAPGDRPAWNLGVNLAYPEGADRSALEADLRALLELLVELRLRTGRDFVVGVNGEDVCEVDGTSDWERWLPTLVER